MKLQNVHTPIQDMLPFHAYIDEPIAIEPILLFIFDGIIS